MKKIKSFAKFNEAYKVNNITEDDILMCIKNNGVIYSDIVSDYPKNENWQTEPLTPVDIEENFISVNIEGEIHYVKLENVKKIEYSEKPMNELFDTEDLKSQFEIDYLSNKIDKKKMSKDILPKFTSSQVLATRLMNDVSYVKYMMLSAPVVSGEKSELYLKKEEVIKYSDADTVVFMIEINIVINRSRDYILSYKIDTLGNGKTLFHRQNDFGVMDYNKLINVMNGEIKSNIIEWNVESQRMFNKKILITNDINRSLN